MKNMLKRTITVTTHILQIVLMDTVLPNLVRLVGNLISDVVVTF